MMTERYRKEHPFIAAMKDMVDELLRLYPDMSLRTFSNIIDGFNKMDELQKIESAEEKQLAEVFK